MGMAAYADPTVGLAGLLRFDSISGEIKSGIGKIHNDF